LPDNLVVFGRVDAEALMKIEGAAGFLQFIGLDEETQSQMGWPSFVELAWGASPNGLLDVNESSMFVVTGKEPLADLRKKVTSKPWAETPFEDNEHFVTYSDKNDDHYLFLKAEHVALSAQRGEDIQTMLDTASDHKCLSVSPLLNDHIGWLDPCFVSVHVNIEKVDRGKLDEIRKELESDRFIENRLEGTDTRPEDILALRGAIDRVLNGKGLSLVYGIPVEQQDIGVYGLVATLANETDAAAAELVAKDLSRIVGNSATGWARLGLENLQTLVDGDMLIVYVSGERAGMEQNLIKLMTIAVPNFLIARERSMQARAEAESKDGTVANPNP